ncbi:nuclear transport factor 2-like [Phoenix dactylifera]|uniref:Nuclear transport factor 2-like n=1 Tax=Phoenix dactylifera TaxID=42345 RepID=A0A8B8IZZ2_PHODC|nr:nuclear transport factor 2-like [Phoenix dactylifera]XP_038987050.1 nuclear transport factor 2-like [Phoenix dactylifera]
MSSITTMQAINEKILSMDYREFGAEIKVVDAQEPLDSGVLVLITGYLIGKENIRRSFIQSFFLATQDKGGNVLNDIFRFVEEADEQRGTSGLVNGTGVTLLEILLWITLGFIVKFLLQYLTIMFFG